jgi:hypothetical protein
MLTILLPVDPNQIEEAIGEYDPLRKGQILEGEEDLELEVMDYHQYSPLGLNDDFRIALAMVHAVGEPLPPKEEWFCQQSIISSHACWHVYVHDGEVLRLSESPNGSLPRLGKPFFHYCTDTPFEQAPKLDRASLLKFAATIQQRPTGLESHSFKKYVNPDAQFREIYVIELKSSKVLCAA